MASRKKCEDLSADRCFLLSIPYFFDFAGAAGTFLLRCWAWYCHKFLQKKKNKTKQNKKTQQKKKTCCYKRAIVELIGKYERYLLNHAQTLPVYAYVNCLVTRQRSWFKFHRVIRGTYNYSKRLILPCSDKALLEFHTCMQTNTIGLRFYKDSLECFVQLVFASKCFYPCR